MIDINILREQPDVLKANLARRSAAIDVDRLVELDVAVRSVRRQAEEARAEQRVIGKEIAGLPDDDRPTAIARAGVLAEEYKRLSAEADGLQAEFDELWVTVPNLAHDSVPTGETDADNVEVKQWGVPRTFTFEVRDHQVIGEALGIIDVATGAKVSGSRFAYLKGQAVMLELGLVRWALELLAAEGFTPVIPPVLVRENALYGTGFFPGDKEQVYAVGVDDLYLVGTAEVPLAALHADEILTGGLPIRYAGFSTCFRREAGTYGKDTTGIFRVHQFDKVEMFSFCDPDTSWEEHEFLFGMEERIVQALELPYRVMNVAAGDLGASAAKKYDIEAWIPSQGAYREITSCSNTTDYQARRLKIRTRSEEGDNRIIHTLNGTAVAVGRTILAIIENHQQADGTVVIPEAIRGYVGFDVLGA